MPEVLSIDKPVKTSQPHSMTLLISAILAQQTLGALCFPISKFGLAYIDPFTFAFYRFVISSLALWVILKAKHYAIPIERKDYWKMIGLGFLIIPFNQMTYLLGQSMTAAGHGALLFATMPIWIFLFAVIHLKEKLVFRRGAGIVVALIGVVTIMTSGAVRIGTEYLWGDLLILVAVLAFAYYSILGKPLVLKYGAIRVTAHALIWGSAMYFPFGLYSAVTFDYLSAPVSAWWTVIYMALGTSVLAYVLWYWVLKHLEASRIAVFHNVQPLIATVVAYLWLNEPMGISFIVGGLVVITGVLIAEL